ncbi:hypothetical protein [Rhizobium rhizosphaerae]|nr:hypothetical protein [Xaviernesmea rhizosphaerae]
MIFAERDAGDLAMIVANPDLARRELGWGTSSITSRASSPARLIGSAI